LSVDLENIERLYTEGLQKYGPESRSVGWKTPESQRLRFEKLVQVVQDRKEAITVTELGCGYGALFPFLIEAGFDVRVFLGYDISSAMLDAARNSVKDSRAEFIHAPEVTHRADYTFASGIFNVRFDIEEDLWLSYVERTLDNMNDHSEKGFSFNMLTTYVDYREKHLFYGNPFHFFDVCRKRFSKKVSLLHDYDLWEWTMIVKKV
jgi:SAM-dependent methyltransferase